MRLLAIGVALLVAAMAVLSAQDVPILSDVQKLQIQNAILKVQLAQSEFERAKDQANTLIHGLQQPGYVLNLETMQYTPVTETPAK